MKKSLKEINFSGKKNFWLKITVFLFALFVLIDSVIFSTPSASADITTGLVGYWKMDETSGTTATDSTGSNNGTVNGATWTTGKIGNGLSFNGTSNYVNYSTDLGVTGEMTVSAWVNPAQAPTGTGRLIASTYDWDADPALTRGWYLGVDYGSTDVIRFRIYDSSGNTGAASLNNFFANNLNKWTHVVGVYKPSTYIKLFVNGVLVAEDTSSVPSAIANKAGTNFRIGARADVSSQGLWNGLLDEVRVYNRALTAQDVAELYNLSSPTSVTDAASNTTFSSATLNGTVNPNGLDVIAFFEYGTESGSYPTKTSDQNLATNPASQSITADISGLTGNTNYYYRVVVSNSMGTSYGAEQSFLTPQTISEFFPAPQNFGVGISFISPTDPSTTLFWKAPPAGGIYPPLANYEAENLGEWGPISISTSTLYYTDEDVLNGTYYIYEVAAVYEDTSTLTYKSESASILIRVPTATECQCGVWKNCPYQTNIVTYKYAVNFMSQLQPPPSSMATSSDVSTSFPPDQNLPAGDYRVKLVSAFKNFSSGQQFSLLDNRWFANLKDTSGATITQTSPSSNFSDYNSTPYYAHKNEIVDESLSVPADADFAQAVWTGVPIDSTPPAYNQINAVCAYFEKIDPSTGLPYTGGGGGGGSQVSIDSFTATPSPVNSGSTTVLSWTSTNADYCSASGGWSGFKSLSGTATTTPIYGTTVFGLKCVSADGESEMSTSVSVSVNSSENTITAVNCQPSPQVANIGQDITWTVAPIPASGLYTYSWSGDDNLFGSSQTVAKSYSTTGTKTGIVDIGGATNPQQCTGTVRITASPSFDEF